MPQILITILVSAVVGAVAYFAAKSSNQSSDSDKGSSISVDSKEENITSELDSSEEVMDAKTKASQIIIDAKNKAKELVIEAKEKAVEIKAEAEEKSKSAQEKSALFDKKMAVKLAEIKTTERELDKEKARVDSVKQKIEQKLESAEKLQKSKQGELEKIASLTKDEAREQLMKVFERDLAAEKGKRVRELESEIKETAEAKAQEMIIDAMRYGATDYVVQYTTSKVKLPDEDVKGKIIGKEGRNIKNFEELTGVELDLDSSPGDVIVSCFDPIRREVGRVALERLIADGRVHPAKIEEIVNKTRKEIDEMAKKAGDNLCHKAGAYKLPNEVVEILGRFKFRFSYGQNMLEHTLEVVKIGVALAKELNLDVNTVRLGCLLHDIGKVITDKEGSHVDLGVELLKRHKIDSKVVDAVAEHHEDRPFSSLESAVVALADHISGARPGTRSEDYSSYIERMQDLEGAATYFDGVEKAYAISAGRELRVFVKPDAVDDASTALLAREIARKIELEQTYPGTVKVHVIRETRYSETAK